MSYPDTAARSRLAIFKAYDEEALDIEFACVERIRHAGPLHYNAVRKAALEERELRLAQARQRRDMHVAQLQD